MMVPAVRRRFRVRYNSSSLCRLHIQCGGPFHRTRGRQSLPSRTRRRQQQQQGGRRRRRRRSVERRRLSRMSQRRSHRFVFASVCVTNVKNWKKNWKKKEKEEKTKRDSENTAHSVSIQFKSSSLCFSDSRLFSSTLSLARDVGVRFLCPTLRLPNVLYTLGE